MASGELPPWLDVDGVTRGFLALLDGLLLQRIEAGAAYRPGDLERRAMAVMAPMLAAAGVAAPGGVDDGAPVDGAATARQSRGRTTTPTGA